MLARQDLDFVGGASCCAPWAPGSHRRWCLEAWPAAFADRRLVDRPGLRLARGWARQWPVSDTPLMLEGGFAWVSGWSAREWLLLRSEMSRCRPVAVLRPIELGASKRTSSLGHRADEGSAAICNEPFEHIVVSLCH